MRTPEANSAKPIAADPSASRNICSPPVLRGLVLVSRPPLAGAANLHAPARMAPPLTNRL